MICVSHFTFCITCHIFAMVPTTRRIILGPHFSFSFTTGWGGWSKPSTLVEALDSWLRPGWVVWRKRGWCVGVCVCGAESALHVLIDIITPTTPCSRNRAADHSRRVNTCTHCPSQTWGHLNFLFTGVFYLRKDLLPPIAIYKYIWYILSLWQCLLHLWK